MERSVLIQHLKTSCYALSVFVLTGWFADALNENLIFRTILRFFRPQDVARYAHPFADWPSFFIWFIPLLFTGLLLMFTSVMALHHVKKPHLYQIIKKKALPHYPHVVGLPTLGNLAKFLTSYAKAEKISLLLPKAQQSRYQAELALNQQYCNLEVHWLKEQDDLQKVTLELEQWVKKELKHAPAGHGDILFLDITYAAPLYSSAALFCSLEQDVQLLQHSSEGSVLRYDLICQAKT
ncbi:hypothetical protein [Serratia microhaemolytica]|uniref:hypothetical protein n=1 Tax=Serratia microhaemolytica TaxID=2675110 RepID=UPI000FDE865B|nr:hypothetical protein [Serratia microhaemolytica]